METVRLAFYWRREQKQMTADLFENDDEIRRVVERFESCEFKPDEFKHRHHLTVALWYLATNDKDAAIDRMRTQLKKFTSHFQVNAYHETKTIFWMEVASAFKKRHGNLLSFPELLNRMITTYASSKTILNFYSQELLDTDRAKHTWSNLI